MAGNAIDILINIKQTGEAALSTLKSGIDKVNQASYTYQQTLNGLNQKASEFTANIQRLVAAVGAFKLGEDMVKTAASFEKTKLMLEGLTGSAANAEAAFQWIRAFAAKTPFDMDAVSQAFTKLKSVGIDPTAGSLQILTDAVAAFGGGSDELNRVIIAITQMSGKGVISMEELRQQLGEVLPTAMQSMADQMGLSMAQLTKKIESGSLDAQTGIDAMLKGLEKRYKGAAQTMMGGWIGLVAQLRSTWQGIENDIMTSGAFDKIKGVLKEVLAEINRLRSDGTLAEWSKKVSDAISWLVTMLVQAGKYLAEAASYVAFFASALKPLWDVISPHIATLTAFVVGWVSIKFAMSTLLGIPALIVRELTALNAAFTVMTGTGFISWLTTGIKSGVASIAALSNSMGILTGAVSTVAGVAGMVGLAFASVWSVGKIAELVKVLKEYNDALNESARASAQYSRKAAALADMADYQLKTYEEARELNARETQDYYRNLQLRLQYWKDYWSALETSKPETVSMFLETGESITAGEEELKAWQARMDEANSQIGKMMDAFTALGKAARENGIDVTTHAEALKQDAEAAKASLIDFEKLKEYMGILTKEYEYQKDAIKSAADFEVNKLEARVSETRSVAWQVLEIRRDELSQTLALVEASFKTQLGLLDRSKADEQKYAETSRKLSEDLNKDRLAAVKDWLDYLKKGLVSALADEQKYAAEIAKLKKSLADTEKSYQSDIRDVKREDMTEEEAYEDKRKQMVELLTASQKKLLEGTEESTAEAKALAEEAYNIAKALPTELKQGEDILMDKATGIDQKLNDMANAHKAVVAAIKTEASQMGDQLKDAQERVKQFTEEVEKAQKKADELGKTQVNIKATFEVDDKDVNAAIERLKGQTITIPVYYKMVGKSGSNSGGSGYGTGESLGSATLEALDTSDIEKYGGYRWGGMIRRFAQGGWNLLSGMLPGWGGGDRVKALLEPGEFIIRKEAVARYGAGLFEALNTMRMDLPRLAGSLMPRLPAVSGASPGGETLTVKFAAGGEVYPVTIHERSSREMMKQFTRKLEKMRLTSGR